MFKSLLWLKHSRKHAYENVNVNSILIELNKNDSGALTWALQIMWYSKQIHCERLLKPYTSFHKRMNWK